MYGPTLRASLIAAAVDLESVGAGDAEGGRAVLPSAVVVGDALGVGARQDVLLLGRHLDLQMSNRFTNHIIFTSILFSVLQLFLRVSHNLSTVGTWRKL